MNLTCYIVNAFPAGYRRSVSASHSNTMNQSRIYRVFVSLIMPFTRPCYLGRYVARRIVFVGVRLLTRDSVKFPKITSFASHVYLWGTGRFEMDYGA
ncbi:MAG: hypothetical protein GY880_20655 [Planctomycetaceae bacterium]|nr:hypothetical protein [Planctomycetaceae bacterium]